MPDETISLYFGVEDGQTADLEIISAAAIAWVETLRAAARAVDPDSDIRVGLVDVNQSSAIYNVIGDWFERHVEPTLERIERGRQRAPRSRKLLLGLALFTLSTAVPTYNEYFGDDFDEEDRARMKRIEEMLAAKPAAVETARQKLYRTLERERAINSVAIKERPDAEPIVLISRDAFPQEGGLFTTMEEGVQERVTTTVLELFSCDRP